MSVEKTFARMISDYCNKVIATAFPPREAERIRHYLLGCLESRSRLPSKGKAFDWKAIATACVLEESAIMSMRPVLKPIFDALARELLRLPPLPRNDDSLDEAVEMPRKIRAEPSDLPTKTFFEEKQEAAPVRKKRRRRRKQPGPSARPIVQFPPALFDCLEEPETFHEALALQMRRHGDTCRHLHRAIIKKTDKLDERTISSWRSGQKTPRSLTSMNIIQRIERRYRLPSGYFKAKLLHRSRAANGHSIPNIGPAEQRRLAWHLPDDFADRSRSEQEEILCWVRTVVISGATSYRQFQAAAMKNRYAVRFPTLGSKVGSAVVNSDEDEDAEQECQLDPADPELICGTIPAPPDLALEMEELIRFKTSTLTAVGYQRIGVWGEETTAQKIEHLGLMFGALAASPRSAVRGFGVPLQALTFALLIFPRVWDWYVNWRERRRGFYTAWEVDMLRVGLALTRKDTGWLRQSPKLADRLVTVPGLVSYDDVHHARHNWSAACDEFHQFATLRVAEIRRVARVHRDPFEPILAILETDSPVAEYRKIADEILRLMPDERRYPRCHAESVRSYLMIRFGLHLGLRQKNLRQLLFCPRDQIALSARELNDRKRGELRWNAKENGWEVFIPASAFKNAGSSFFAKQPFRLMLPNLADLYQYLDAYVDRHRAVLLKGAKDPKTFFVKTVKVTSASAEYHQTSFYEAWRLTIQRFGVHNPYTNRGAIKGLLPHGPHNVRDVLATHVLKKTGSYEQASYAIQDTPDMVAKHYGRFLPQDKAALAAEILNRVWVAA